MCAWPIEKQVEKLVSLSLNYASKIASSNACQCEYKIRPSSLHQRRLYFITKAHMAHGARAAYTNAILAQAERNWELFGRAYIEKQISIRFELNQINSCVVLSCCVSIAKQLNRNSPKSVTNIFGNLYSPSSFSDSTQFPRRKLNCRSTVCFSLFIAGELNYRHFVFLRTNWIALNQSASRRTGNT